MPLIDLTCDSADWAGLGLQGLADRAAQATLAAIGLDPAEYEISLLAADDATIAQLNAQFRGKPVPTNVLSWPAQALDPPVAGGKPSRPVSDPHAPRTALGDIALAFGVCGAEASEQGKPLPAHLTHLIVHGTLHLLGYDHMRDTDATQMETLETEILASLGVADPYERGDDE